MSFFENFGNNVNTRMSQMADRIQDSDTFQKLSERYQGLTPQGQKLATAGVIIAFAALFLYWPMSSLLTSQNEISLFENRRGLIKELFKTYRDSTGQSGISPAPSADQLIGQINSNLQSNDLLPEQIAGVERQETPADGLIPTDFVREVINVNLVKLNLRQIVDIGNLLNRLSASVKMKDLTVGARNDMPGYFDVTYKLYSLNIPEIQMPASELDQSNDKPRKKKSSKSDSDNAASGDDE